VDPALSWNVISSYRNLIDIIPRSESKIGNLLSL